MFVWNETYSKGKTAVEAFTRKVVEDIRNLSHLPHFGLTEKRDFVVVNVNDKDTLEKMIEKIKKQHPSDLHANFGIYGKVGCVPVSEDEYMFFGYVSSKITGCASK